MKPDYRNARKALLCAAVLLALGGCGEEKKPAASQVLARVNGKEVTVLQLNYLLSQRPGDELRADSEKQKVLDDLVQQEMLVQKAQNDKLDRDPMVVQALEFARRQVLAQAVLQRALGNGKSAAPTEDEVSGYYQQHADAFRERRKYVMTTFLVPEQEMDDQALQEFGKVKNERDADIWFAQRGIHLQKQRIMLTSDKVPERLGKQMQKMKPGDVLADKSDGQRLLMMMIASENAALTLDEAQEEISQQLYKAHRKELLDQQLASLRKESTIEYLKRFASEPVATTAKVEGDKAGNASLASGLKGLQ